MSNRCMECARAMICLGSYPLQFTTKILKRGEHLCYQGEQSHNLYILKNGALKSYTTKRGGQEFVMGFYFPPDLFGWEGIAEPSESVSIVALDQSHVCIIPTELLFTLSEQNPRIGTRLLRMVSRRIQQDNTALLRTTAQQRVATFLLQLELRYRELGFAKQIIQLPMTHQDIANYLHITPSTISRILRELQTKNLIAIDKHQVKLLNIAEISLMADTT